jgi:hypothetical protein
LVRKSSSEHWLSLERLTIMMLGIYLGGVGLHMALRGHLTYRNYLNAPVLAPVALAIGGILVIAAFVLRL